MSDSNVKLELISQKIILEKNGKGIRISLLRINPGVGKKKKRKK